MSRRVLVPLPDRDFDPTEAAVPWKLLREAGHEVVFATERGARPEADPLMLTGVVFGKLGAEPEPLAFYRELETDAAFASPIAWNDIDIHQYDALYLGGGHAQGMRQYLEGTVLRERVVDFWRTGKPVAALCHGVLVLARAIDPATGHSVLRGVRTTCLPKFMERAAYLSTFWKVGRYYRTYPAYVEEEVRAALASPDDFQRGPWVLTKRATRNDDTHAFIVEDGHYISARWPGDAYLIAQTLIERLR